MNALHHSPLAASRNATFMETIMQPLSFARRSARWLMAAGLGVDGRAGITDAGFVRRLCQGRRLHGGEREPGRHQPARRAPGE